MKTENSKEIRLWDLIDSNVYVKIKSPLREDFFNYLIKISGGYRKLSKKVNTTFGHLFQQKKGMYFLSIKLLKKLLEECSNDKKPFFENEIEKNIEELKVRSNSASIKDPMFPIRLTKAIARIAGHLVGDGGIKSNLIVHYTNEKPELLESFRNDVLDAFGYVKYGSYLHKNKEHIKTVWFPRIVGVLLTKMMGKQVKRHKHIPKIIKEADGNLKSAFLGSLFDDEGSVSVDAYSISIMMTGRKLVNDVKKLLGEIGISCGKISTYKPSEFAFGKEYTMRLNYQFYISGKINLRKFSELITLDHIEKKKNMRKLIQKYKNFKFEELKNLILEQIILCDYGVSPLDISKRLNIGYVNSRHFLYRLEKEGIVLSKGKPKIYVIK